LKGEAQEISSQLATLIQRADELADRFDLEVLRQVPELSILLQFLAHAMRVAESDEIADEVEDLLRASLVYHQAQRKGDDSVRTLVRLCRAYLYRIRDHQNILVLADQTGFAIPSVLSLLAQKSESRELAVPANWEPERLFGDDIAPLRERVEAIADLPEMQLGQLTPGPFNSTRIAAILRDWVSGDTLHQLSEKYPISKSAGAEKRVRDFSNYLFSQLLGRASWGIGALEGVCLAGQDPQLEPEEAGYVPSMIFFGVREKEAVWLRTVGVPRIVAGRLGVLWKQQVGGAPNSYDEVRRWVADLDDGDWRGAIPETSTLSPDDMRMIWREFAG
jgi:hypothetical protein